MPSGRITSVKIWDGSKWWDTLPAEIGRFTNFTLTVYVYVETSDSETFRATLTFTDPKGARHEIEPQQGTLKTGAYFFEFPLTTGSEAEIGVWSAEIALQYLSEGNWLQLDRWQGEVFKLIVVGEPQGTILAVNYTKNFADFFTVPLNVSPGETYGFRVWFQVFLPDTAPITAELRLIDPNGNTVTKETPSETFPPGPSQGYAELKIDKFPDQPEGKWLGKATILTIWKGTWVTLAEWDGYVATLQAAPAPTQPSPITALTALVATVPLLNFISSRIEKEVRA